MSVHMTAYLDVHMCLTQGHTVSGLNISAGPQQLTPHNLYSLTCTLTQMQDPVVQPHNAHSVEIVTERQTQPLVNKL